MSTQHKNLTEVDLHETKGVSTAAANTVHQADGSGHSSWSKVGSANINTASIKNINLYSMNYLNLTPNAVFTHYLVVPFASSLSGVSASLSSAPSATLAVDFKDGATVLATCSFLTSDTYPKVYTPVVAGNSLSAASVINITSASGIASSGHLSVFLTFSMT